MLHGFRWRDRFDHKSCQPSGNPAFTDQSIGTGDGTTVAFQLTKVYGSAFSPYTRDIKKPVIGSVKVGVNGVEQTLTTDFTVDTTTGIITFVTPPTNTHPITAGFEFDIPVRFDTDNLIVDMAAFDAGDIPDIPVLEIRL